MIQLSPTRYQVDMLLDAKPFNLVSTNEALKTKCIQEYEQSNNFQLAYLAPDDHTLLSAPWFFRDYGAL